MCLYIFVYLNILHNNYDKKRKSAYKICKLDNAMNANEVCWCMLMRKCLLVMLILMLVILMLILMLLNLNTGYADTYADLSIRIMSLCCMKNYQNLSKYDPKHLGSFGGLEKLYRVVKKDRNLYSINTCLCIIVYVTFLYLIWLYLYIYTSIIHSLNLSLVQYDFQIHNNFLL